MGEALPTRIDRDQLKALWPTVLTDAQLADRLGFCRGSFRRAAKEIGLPPRTVARAQAFAGNEIKVPADLAAQIEASRRSQQRRRADTALARTRALAATVGAHKRTDQVLAYVTATTRDELKKHAAELGVVTAGLAAYLIELGIRKLFPECPRRSRPNPIVTCACGCGGQFEAMDDHSRARRFLKGHNLKARAANRPSAPIACACGCGGMMESLDAISRPRRFLKGHNAKLTVGTP